MKKKDSETLEYWININDQIKYQLNYFMVKKYKKKASVNWSMILRLEMPHEFKMLGNPKINSFWVNPKKLP